MNCVVMKIDELKVFSEKLETNLKTVRKDLFNLFEDDRESGNGISRCCPREWGDWYCVSEGYHTRKLWNAFRGSVEKYVT